MGTISNGTNTVTVASEELLAYVQAAIEQRFSEAGCTGFFITFALGEPGEDAFERPGENSHIVLWLHPSTPVAITYGLEEPVKFDQERVAKLVNASRGSGGLVLGADIFDL